MAQLCSSQSYIPCVVQCIYMDILYKDNNLYLLIPYLYIASPPFPLPTGNH